MQSLNILLSERVSASLRSKQSFQRISNFTPSQSPNHRLPSHHALSFSLRCGISSLISVSPPSYTLVLGLLLERPFLSTTLFRLELLASLFSSVGKVDLGVIVSLLLLLIVLAAPGVVGARELMSTLMGLWLRRLLSRVLVAGGRLI